MPSSSARCAQLPRAEDKLPFFIALRKLRDFVKGRISHLNDQEVIFTDYTEFRVTQPDPKSLRKAERRRKRKAEQMMAVTGSEQLIGITKPRKSKTMMNNIQSQKSNSISSTKDNDYMVTSQDITPTTLPDDSSSQIEIPVALLNQSNGIISLVPSEFLINGSLGGFSIANQNTFLTLNNKTNSSVATNKPIILQQDTSGQTYMLTTSSPLIQQGTTLSVPQLTALAAATNQSTTATIMPWGGNTFALIQPSHIMGTNQTANDPSNATGLSWNNNTISVQGSPQIITQPNLFYQKSNNNSGCQQIICTTSTLQQLLQQQQQIQIVNPLAFSQPIAIQTPIGLNGGFGNIQFQQIANCLTENLGNDQLSSNNSDPLLQQETLCQPSCSMTPPSNDNVVIANSSNGQNNQSGSSSIISTASDTQPVNAHQTTTILGYSVAPNSQQSTQTIGLSSNPNVLGNQNITLAYISNQHTSPHQSQTGAFSSLNNSNATHIVIPISGSNLGHNGNIVQITDQQQRLICSQGSVANIVNCFASCGSLTNGSLSNNNYTNNTNNNNNNSNNSNNISASNNNSSNGSNGNNSNNNNNNTNNNNNSNSNNNNTNNTNNNSQLQSSRTIASSTSTSGISSVAGQNDLDLISSSSGGAETSTSNHLYHQHCTAPVQLADCEDQLVQCSSTDEKLVYAAL